MRHWSPAEAASVSSDPAKPGVSRCHGGLMPTQASPLFDTPEVPCKMALSSTADGFTNRATPIVPPATTGGVLLKDMGQTSVLEKFRGGTKPRSLPCRALP